MAGVHLMPRITLVFPPAADPRSPHLGVAALAAAAKTAGILAEVIDLDLEGLLAILRPEQLARWGRKLRSAIQAGWLDADRHEIDRLAALSESLPAMAQDALRALRDPTRFYDPNENLTAREVLYEALRMVSAAFGNGVSYQINPAGYTVRDVEPGRLVDLIRVTGDSSRNLFADDWDDLIYRPLKERRPDLVGISIVNRQQIVPGLMLARELRRRNYFVVIGGTAFSKFTGQLAKLPEFFQCFADGVVVYEGDTAIVELAWALTGARDFRRVPNYLYLENGRVQRTGLYTENIDALPTPDFSGFALDRYLAPRPVLPILMGKGCYHSRCRFCEIPFVNRIAGTNYRRRSPQRVLEDILNLNTRYGCRHFEFTDETLAPRALEELAEALTAHAHRQFCFTGYARFDPAFTADRCGQLARMGLKKLFIGLESGDQATLDHMCKGVEIADVRNTLRHLREAGIYFHIFSIIGFPEESEASALKTLAFFKENADLIDRPGNSFDIHGFGLELRSEYAARALDFGISINPAVLAQDFAFGAGTNWTNPRGIAHPRLQDLLTQFDRELSEIYQFYRDPEYPWPAFEEYAVLYADHYGESDFPFPAWLPAPSDVVRWRLRLNPAAVAEPTDKGTIFCRTSGGAADIDIRTYRVLCRPQFRIFQDILDETASTIAGCANADNQCSARYLVRELLEKKILQIEPGRAFPLRLYEESH